MKKLLHERLREWADSTEGDKYPSTKMLYATIESDHAPLGADDERKAFHLLADEIEKYYTPRPRFEDGEPVQRTDKVDWENLRDYHPQLPWMITAIRNDGTPIATAGDKVVAVAKITDDGFVKRHEPKVLDADGVPIEVGDTVWVKHSGVKQVITRIENGNVHGDVGHEPTPLDPTCLTHREPDSLSKLRDDLENKYGKESQWVKRLTAIMERDA